MMHYITGLRAIFISMNYFQSISRIEEELLEICILELKLAYYKHGEMQGILCQAMTKQTSSNKCLCIFYAILIESSSSYILMP